MEHLGTVEIHTERLLLREFRINDFKPAFRNWQSDQKATEFLRWSPHKSIEETKKIISSWINSYKDNTFYHWAIELKSLKEPIGSISVVSLSEELNLVHIGYCIGSPWWNKGLTSEALSAIIPFFFDQIKVNRIESQHDPNNPNSGKVMLKCGLQYEGTLRQADFNNKGVVDAAIYSILASDYNNYKR